jgi:hypothetical protein
VGTGFIWREQNSVITALHLVAGCGAILVYSEKVQGAEISAQIVKILKGADLAILRLNTPIKVIPLSRHSKPPPAFTTVYSFGYPLGIPNLTSTVLSVRFGGRKLREIVPDRVRSELEAAGSPDIDLNILHLQGPLQPGTSGSPILNDAGEVIAVVDGGLAAGAASASFAIPATYIPELEKSSVLAHIPLPSSVAFSAELDSRDKPKIKCGSEELTKMRTARYQDIVTSADDPDTLERLVFTSYVEPSDIEFDIYEHVRSGGTVVLPSSTAVSVGTGHCTASDVRLQFIIQLIVYKSGFELQQKTDDFERSLVPEYSKWVVDMTYTQIMHRRFDGLIVTRKGAYHVPKSEPNAVPDRYLYETLAAKNGFGVLVIVINNKADPETRTKEYGCAKTKATDAVCLGLMPGYRRWVSAVLGTELTTFSIN